MARPPVIAAALALLLTSSALASPILPQARQAELIHRLKHDCGSCHGMTLKGGLGPPLLPADLAGKSDQSLAEIILQGVPGTPMPPWQGELSTAEATWLVEFLRSGDAP